MTSNTNRRGRRSGRKRPLIPRLPLISLAFVVLAGALFINELITFSQQEDRIPIDVAVGNIPIGGLSRAEAEAVIEGAYAQPVTLYYNNSPIMLDPAEIGWRLNTQSMLADAISVGEEEGSFWRRFFNYLTQQEIQNAANLDLSGDYQRSLLVTFLEDVARRYDRTTTTSSFDVNTLTTFPSEGSAILNIELAIDRIDAALRQPQNRVVDLPVSGQDSGRPQLSTLEDLIIAYLDNNGFIYNGTTTVAGVFVMDLTTGEEISINGDVAFSAASTIKAPIMVDYFRRLDREVNDDEAFIMANSLLCSTNSSTNLLLDIIGSTQSADVYTGLALVNETMQQIGANNTYITAPLEEPGVVFSTIARPATVAPNPNIVTAADNLNQTTPEDMGTLFTMLYDCANYGSGMTVTFPDNTITQRECRQMLELMSANDLERLLMGGIPEDVRISHKNGWLNLSAVVGDAGIVYPPNGNDYVIAVFLWEDTTQDLATAVGFERLWPLLEGISRATWNHFSPDAALTSTRVDQTRNAAECNPVNGVGYLPPYGQVNLDDINAWRR